MIYKPIVSSFDIFYQDWGAILVDNWFTDKFGPHFSYLGLNFKVLIIMIMGDFNGGKFPI